MSKGTKRAPSRKKVGILRTAVVFFYITNESLSLVENAETWTVYPKSVLEQLHDHEAKEVKK